jgi:Ca-activated chloride channel family protein
MTRPAFRLAASLVLWCSITSAQVASIRVDVNLVVVPVTVTDRAGRTVVGLPRSTFHLFEEGQPQTIASFTHGDAPASIGFVLDVSGSMKDKLAVARATIHSLLADPDPEDEAAFLTFADRPDVRAPLTHDVERLDRFLQSGKAGGSTALIDSVYRALDSLKNAGNTRKALVIVSDGQDNHSRYSRGELMAKAVESDVQIYSIAVIDPPRNRKPIELVEDARGRMLLEDLSRATGGLYFEISAGRPEAAVIASLGRTLHDQYLLGYYPEQGVRAGWRRIRVKVDLPGARLYARNRYFAAVE